MNQPSSDRQTGVCLRCPGRLQLLVAGAECAVVVRVVVVCLDIVSIPFLELLCSHNIVQISVLGCPSNESQRLTTEVAKWPRARDTDGGLDDVRQSLVEKLNEVDEQLEPYNELVEKQERLASALAALDGGQGIKKRVKWEQSPSTSTGTRDRSRQRSPRG